MLSPEGPSSASSSSSSSTSTNASSSNGSLNPLLSASTATTLNSLESSPSLNSTYESWTNSGSNSSNFSNNSGNNAIPTTSSPIQLNINSYATNNNLLASSYSSSYPSQGQPNYWSPNPAQVAANKNSNIYAGNSGNTPNYTLHSANNSNGTTSNNSLMYAKSHSQLSPQLNGTNGSNPSASYPNYAAIASAFNNLMPTFSQPSQAHLYQPVMHHQQSPMHQTFYTSPIANNSNMLDSTNNVQILNQLAVAAAVVAGSGSSTSSSATSSPCTASSNKSCHSPGLSMGHNAKMNGLLIGDLAATDSLTNNSNHNDSGFESPKNNLVLSESSKSENIMSPGKSATRNADDISISLNSRRNVWNTSS